VDARHKAGHDEYVDALRLLTPLIRPPFRHKSSSPRPRFSRVRGVEVFPSKSEGPGAPPGAGYFLSRGGKPPAAHRLTAAPVRRRPRAFAPLCACRGDFSARVRAFREAMRKARASPSASSSRRLVVAGGGIPCRPGRRGCEPRPRAPVSRIVRLAALPPVIPKAARGATAPFLPECRSASRRL
jgi:hypothetical protein